MPTVKFTYALKRFFPRLKNTAADGKTLQEIFKEIDSFEKTKVDVNKYTRYDELYLKWLLLAMMFYGAGWVMGQTWLRRIP